MHVACYIAGHVACCRIPSAKLHFVTEGSSMARGLHARLVRCTVHHRAANSTHRAPYDCAITHSPCTMRDSVADGDSYRRTGHSRALACVCAIARSPTDPLLLLVLASPRLASPRLASPRLASPRLASPRLASPRLASPFVCFLVVGLGATVGAGSVAQGCCAGPATLLPSVLGAHRQHLAKQMSQHSASLSQLNTTCFNMVSVSQCRTLCQMRCGRSSRANSTTRTTRATVNGFTRFR